MQQAAYGKLIQSLHVLCSLVEYYVFVTDKNDLLPLEAAVGERLNKIEGLFVGDGRMMANLQLALEYLEEAINLSGLRTDRRIIDPAMPKVFATMEKNCGAQVAANLLAIDMVLTDLKSRFGDIGVGFKARIATEIENKFEHLGNDDVEPTLVKLLEILELPIREAQALLDLGGNETNIAPLIEAAYCAIRILRPKMPWRVAKETPPLIAEEIGLRKMTEDESGLSLCLARIKLVGKLLSEAKVNLNILRPQSAK
jgi:hypothetical protein